MREGHRRLMIPLPLPMQTAHTGPAGVASGSDSGGGSGGHGSLVEGGASDRAGPVMGYDSLMGRFERVLRDRLVVVQVVPAPTPTPAPAAPAPAPAPGPESQAIIGIPSRPVMNHDVASDGTVGEGTLAEGAAFMLPTSPAYAPTTHTEYPTTSDIVGLLEREFTTADDVLSPIAPSPSAHADGATSDVLLAASPPPEQPSAPGQHVLVPLPESESGGNQQQQNTSTTPATTTIANNNSSGVPVTPLPLPTGPDRASGELSMSLSLSLDSLNFDLIADTIHRAAASASATAAAFIDSSSGGGGTAAPPVAAATDVNLAGPGPGPAAVEDASSSSSSELSPSTEPPHPPSDHPASSSSDQDASDQSGAPGTSGVLECPPGYEPDVFYSLPQDMQQEIVDQHNETADQVRGGEMTGNVTMPRSTRPIITYLSHLIIPDLLFHNQPTLLTHPHLPPTLCR